jgi:hypothetical protein
MAYDPTAASRVLVGTCDVTFGAIPLGLTKGGVEVAISSETYKVSVDQFGNTEINEYIIGRTVTVTVPLAETDLAKLKLVTPGSTIVTDKTTATKKKLVVNSGTGISLLGVADVLTCHPVAVAATDKSQDFVVPIAAPKGEFNFAYKINEERVYTVVFTGYPNLTTGDLYVIGDSTASAV